MITPIYSQEVIQEIRDQLQQHSSATFRERQQQVIKDSVSLYGVPIPKIKSLIKPYKPRISLMSKADTFTLCETLWSSLQLEEQLIACYWAYEKHADYEVEDLNVFERWILTYVNNTVTCDALCHYAISSILEMYPRLAPPILKWCVSDNRWLRRSSPASTMLLARKGKYLALSLSIADLLRRDPESMNQRAYGELLKELSIHHELDVFEYLTSHKKRISPIAYKASVGHLRPELKVRALEYEEPDWENLYLNPWHEI